MERVAKESQIVKGDSSPRIELRLLEEGVV